MKLLKLFALVFFAMAMVLPQAFTSAGERGSPNQSASDVQAQAPTEAPTGFDNQTNGFVSQSQFEADEAVFNEREEIADGLGPVYNAQSCGECHQNPVAGGISQIT